MGLIGTYFAVYAVLSVLRHQTYHSFGPDLGIFDQIFWNTTQGRPWESTMSLALPQPHSYFGDHFSPVYWLLFPFYAAFPHPEALLVMQTVFLALGAWPIYLLARDRFASGFPRLAWVLAYFLFLPVAFINLFDFHELAFAVLPLGFALYFVERGKVRWFLLSLLASFLVKEELPLIGIGFGAYIFLGKRNPMLGIGVAASSLAISYAVIRYAIPVLGGGQAYSQFAARLSLRYGDLGNDPQQIIQSALTHPLRVARSLFQAKKAAFMIGMFGPVLGLPALSGFAVVLLLPTLAYLLLSNYEPQFSFTSHYAAPLIPLILGTAILGSARLGASMQRWVPASILASSLVFSILYGDLPFSRHFDARMFATEPRYTAFAPELARIPAGASVSSENDLTPHLSHRRFIYNMEYEGPQGADYIALDFAGTNRDLDRFQQQVQSVVAQGYEQIAGGYGLALLKRVTVPTAS